MPSIGDQKTMPHNFVERVEAALQDLRAGKQVILTDDAERENEGDLVLAAQFATAESINFMAQNGRGLICLPMDESIVDRLGLPPMVRDNESSLGTAFTVSIGAKEGITTGISAHDRAYTVQKTIAEGTTRDDLVVPGHVFPLKARKGGVLIRAGHTEGSVDLARLAGLKPAAVICEILKSDGTMARSGDLESFASEHKLNSLSMADLILYRLQKDESLLTPTGHDELGLYKGKRLEFFTFESSLDQSEHWAFRLGFDADHSATNPLEGVARVRVQNESTKADLIQSISNNAHPFAHVLDRLSEAESGVFVYLRKNSNRINTPIEENPQDLPGDSKAFRQYGLGAQILNRLGVRKMELLTDNPKHLVSLEGFGLEMAGSVPFQKSTDGGTH